MDLLLLAVPWLGVGLFVVLFFRNPKGLPDMTPIRPGEAPLVSIIVPARNEEANIGACLTSLAGLDYPAFEILVVDDESRDRTAAVVQSVLPGNASDLHFMEGKPLPDGWFGKPWACWQGAAEARGDLLLFTDADTIHAPGLLGQAVQALKEDHADVLTVIGRQEMVSFWEQLLQPQFFMLLASRYPTVGTRKKPNQWRHAIANGQYLLFRREVYEEVGGHRAVAGEVAEDLRLAQLLVRGGWGLVVRGGTGLRTRMYRSLGGLVEGWSKNVATAALQTTASWLVPIILPLSLVVGVTLWLLPPAVLIIGLVKGGGGGMVVWGGLTTGLSVLIWSRVSALMKGNPIFGFLYPLGSVLGGFIFLRSWWRGTRIEWKGRTYEMPQEARTRPGSGSGPKKAGSS